MNLRFFNVSTLKLGIFYSLIIAYSSSFAQKSEDTQELGLWVSGVKVDGKIAEWSIPLKAYNRSTDLFYTMANDNKFLYLVIQSKDLVNNNKIILGGITVTIKTDGKKKEKDGFKFTYPIINRTKNQNIQKSSGQKTPGDGAGFTKTQRRTQLQSDSIQIARSKTQLATAKELKIFGIKSITDSLISIYNEYGIKAYSTINEVGVFTYELAVPLDLLQLSIDNPKEFSYNIKLNGLQMNNGAVGGNFNRGVGNMDFQALNSATDLWGKYYLVAK